MCQCNERLSAIAPELHPKEVTPMLAQIAQRICSAERVNIFVWYASHQRLYFVSLSSEMPDASRESGQAWAL